jgi:hypothetical protein
VNIGFWLFTAIVVIIAVAFVVIDMLGRVEYLKAKAPWVDPLLEKRATFSALLIFAMFLNVGVGYELLVKEAPPIPEGPKVTISAPAPPIVQFVPGNPTNSQPRTPIQSSSPQPTTPHVSGPTASPTRPQTLQQIPSSGPYEEVKNALSSVETLDREWRIGVIMAEGILESQRRIAAKSNQPKVLLDAQDKFVLDIGNLSGSLDWSQTKSLVNNATRDAIGRMSLPGPMQMTPNQIREENGRCQEAIRVAENGPSIIEVRSYHVSPDRYQALEKYLGDLLEKLGDYSENP